MIFLSHNSHDKPVVEQIALRLKEIYGLDKVFYDAWSIQPGEGIIDKMNKGLETCKFFFFFVSTNSLKSEMVKMEWQNALFRVAQNRIQFIPIRMDSSMMPALLTQSLYIDLFSQGLDVAIRQIVDVINGNNTYRDPIQLFSNMVAYKYREGDKLIVECHAQHYLEPISSFIFCTQHDVNNITAKVRNESMSMTGHKNNTTLNTGYITNIISRSIQKGTLPGFPFVVEFISKVNEYFDIEIVMHAKSHELYQPIPMYNGKKQ